MVRLPIEIDEDTNRRLTELAAEYEGDLSLALADLVHSRDVLEQFAQQSETIHENALSTLRDQAEAGFRENRTVPWNNAKAQAR
jgi:hypothetical protein